MTREDVLNAARLLQAEVDEMGMGDPVKKEYADLRGRVRGALRIAEDAVYEGDHHRMWIIDQMVRALAGERYQTWVDTLGDDWDIGIAP